MGRIRVGVSHQSSENVGNINHPLFVIEKSPFRYHRVVPAAEKERNGNFTTIMRQFPLSIGEKLFIINTKTICVIFYVVTNYKGGEIMEGDLMADHVHMSVTIPPKISVSSFMGY